jgi:hypothetical protein
LAFIEPDEASCDGSRSPKIDLRAVLSDFLVEIDLPSMVREAVAEAVRASALKPW